jgi:preprotein translocase subunit Sss1
VETRKLYDEEKMAKASGVALILIGVVSAIDLFTTALAFKIAYIAALLIIIVGLVCYLRLKCKK